MQSYTLLQCKGVTEKVRTHIKNVHLVSTPADVSPVTPLLSKQAAGDTAKHCPAHDKSETIGKEDSKQAKNMRSSQTKRSAAQAGLFRFGFEKLLSSKNDLGLSVQFVKDRFSHKTGEYLVHPPQIPVYLRDTHTLTCIPSIHAEMDLQHPGLHVRLHISNAYRAHTERSEPN